MPDFAEWLPVLLESDIAVMYALGSCEVVIDGDTDEYDGLPLIRLGGRVAERSSLLAVRDLLDLGTRGKVYEVSLRKETGRSASSFYLPTNLSGRRGVRSRRFKQTTILKQQVRYGPHRY